ncbi:class I tRNA ligase family protein [Chengkuizengella axinellae]|uniref:Class I tRNA ligase family protein n=1 Tax=Chengkuizengella axinellae TaxID=3064388 RepID=A0ABT9J116_9BACL|nr:class I tRNA ligase family protein [Chengkuizengella sp. 2205SS18-9]MDP5274710.1 class I tRNA ligase family protein [Chengkuizengella sp. 2205SS18-9]
MKKLENKELSNVTGTYYKRLSPWKNLQEPPFGSILGVVKPSHFTDPHNHHEGEIFVIIRGEGMISVDNDEQQVESGDVIYLPAFKVHTLKNSSCDQDLVFLGIWWEDIKLLEKEFRLKQKQESKQTLIFASPPTPNGDLHLGHISGPYTGADILNRYLKLKNKESHYITYMDDYQSYVSLKAKQLGKSALETSNYFADIIEDTFKLNNINVENCLRPNNSENYVQFIQDFFMTLYKNGKLLEKEAPSLYCDNCDLYLHEANVRGKCPHCLENSDGNACEQCGQPNDCADLIQPVCKHCEKTPSTINSKHIYFPLSEYENELKGYIKNVSMRSHHRALCEKMLEQGLPDIRVTHTSNWGIPVPLDQYQDQTLYVWFEMCPGYIAATDDFVKNHEIDTNWRKYWKNKNAEVIQFFGFDNSYFHALLFPALYMAFDKEINLPTAFVTNEFLRLEELKFSTSRGHAIWGQDLLKEVPSDVLRFYLSYKRAETVQENFSIDEFEQTVDDELIHCWQGWISKLIDKVNVDFEGNTPHTGGWQNRHRVFYEMLKNIVKEVSLSYEPAVFSLQEVTRKCSELVRRASAFGIAESCYKGISSQYDDFRTSIALELTAAKTLAILITPIMPQFSKHIWESLGLKEQMEWEDVPSLMSGELVVNKEGFNYFTPIKEQLAQYEMSK